jgi:hypothetical protein
VGKRTEGRREREDSRTSTCGPEAYTSVSTWIDQRKRNSRHVWAARDDGAIHAGLLSDHQGERTIAVPGRHWNQLRRATGAIALGLAWSWAESE